MTDRSSIPPKRPRDANQLAYQIVQESTTEETEEHRAEVIEFEKPQKNPAAVELGRLGGLKGGKARAEKLSAEERSEIAKKAARARWKKKR